MSEVHVLSGCTLVVQFCCEDLLPGTTEAFQIFQISRQCMLKPSSQWVNEYVLKALHIGEYLHVNEEWIFFFPFLLCLSHIIYYETHQCLLWLWIKSTEMQRYWNEKQKRIWARGHTIRRKYHTECFALLASINWLLWKHRKLQSEGTLSPCSGLMYRSLQLMQSHQAPELSGGQVNCSI